MNAGDVLEKLKSMESPNDREGMARFGINTKNTLGRSIYKLRPMAKEIGKNHELAQELWKSGVHEARILAVFIDDPLKVSEEQIEAWAKDFDSWDICDQATTSLFDQTEFAWKKVYEWAKRDEEFVKRGAFAMIAGLAVHDKKASDNEFEKLLPIIKKASTDERNYVRKAINWALRNIGKRNKNLNKRAIGVAKEIDKIDDRTAHWIAKDALRGLQNEKVQERLKKKSKDPAFQVRQNLKQGAGRD